MAYPERGYRANSNNFGAIKAKLILLTKYNPINAKIKLPALEIMDTALVTVLDNVDTQESQYSILAAARQELFDDVESKATRIGGEFSSCDVKPRQVTLVHNQVKKVRGERIIALKKPIIPEVTVEAIVPQISPPVDETELETDVIETETEEIIAVETPVISVGPAVPVAPTTHSASHTSFSNLVRALKYLVALLEGNPEYDSNDVELKIPALKLWIKSLEDSSDATDNADNLMLKSHADRDKIFYDNADSALILVQKIKGSVLGCYGATSTEYKEIKAIPFYDNRNG